MRDVRGHTASASPGASAARAASYEDFVATRGPALFRPAYLLAGSAPAAEGLLQTALVRLHLGWHRAAHAESTEASALRILVTTSLSARRPARLLAEPLVLAPAEETVVEPDPVERLVLWPHVPALTSQQRAVVVLRHYEDLSEHQIAAMLGRAPGAVRAARTAALEAIAAGSGSAVSGLGDRLTRELHELADTRSLPRLEPEGLARLGAAEQARRRRVRVTVSTLAVVVVLALGVLPGLLGGSPTAAPAHPPKHPEALAQLARGPGTTLPWWSGGELHVGGRVLPTNHRQVVFAGGTTLVGDEGVEDDHPEAAWWYVDGRRLVPLASSSSGVFRPVVSPGGDLVAWALPLSASRRRLVLWSTVARYALGTLPLRVHPACCEPGGGLSVRGIDSQNRVLFDTSGGTLRMWSAGRPARRVRGIAGHLYDVQAWPGGVSWRPYNDDPLGRFPVTYGILDGQGVLHVEGTVPDQSLWSPDGARYAWTAPAGGSGAGRSTFDRVRVRHEISGVERTMRLPPRESYQLVGWESPDDLVVAVRRDTGRPLRASDLTGRVQLVRCHADSGACETAGLAPQDILELSDGS